ncbi:MAG: hypothetical protein J0M18_09210 [Ignavibacteria bacterium]|nr:hypothetical protein [Ignavibacteria bacterium]
MKFVKLKAMGLPMYKISEELGVHRSTLTMWHQELAPYILIAKQDAMDEMLFENGHSKLDRVQMLCYQLNGLYALLDKRLEDCDENEVSINRTLNQIYKITKIIHLEANEKQIERFMQGSRIKVNIKTMQPISENPEEENDPLFDEAPIWITDAEKFDTHQPEHDYEQYYGTNLDNAKEITDDEFTLDILSEIYMAEDISKKDPAVQVLFKDTIGRKLKARKRGCIKRIRQKSDEERKCRKRKCRKRKSV